MSVRRTDIERALDEIISNEDGMRFQNLAVVLAKEKRPDLFACERKNDLGADAIARLSPATDSKGTALACSITAELGKIRSDATKVKQHFSDVQTLIFATPAKVTNQRAAKWATEILRQFGFELVVMSREDIITSLMVPSNASLCRALLGIALPFEETIADLVASVREAASEVTASWAARHSGRPLLDLRAVLLDQSGRESGEIYQLNTIQAALAQSRRLILEAPAGRGKTTTLVQLAHLHVAAAGTAFLVDLPAWIRSHLDILQFVAGMPPFRCRSIDAGTLERVREEEHYSFLLNGWNEVSATDSAAALDALKDLERSFPSAGIIVATRAHYIAPPLPGASRTRLLPLSRAERTEYLKARLGAKAEALRSMLEGEPTLDDLTRTPLILSEVTTIFEANEPIPTTKMGVLRAVMNLLERSGEHRDHLQLPPLAGRAADYLAELARGMTSQGEVVTPEDSARSTVYSAALKLRDAGQIAEPPEPAAVLNALCAYHILERQDYPKAAFRFQHQQFQELYAASLAKRQLSQTLGKDAAEETSTFLTQLVNVPAWEEPLRMVAEEIGACSTKAPEDIEAARGGQRLVELAQGVDPVFAAELARLCGATVWTRVRCGLSELLRSLYRHPGPHRQLALAGMLAAGSEDFKDVILPLVASPDRQIRLGLYRTGNGLHASTLGRDWQRVVSGWPEEVRVDFVLEMIHARTELEAIASFALADPSTKVRKAAVSAIAWVGSPENLAALMTSLDAETFRAAVLELPSEVIPSSARSQALAAHQQIRCRSADAATRLRALLISAELGELNVADALKVELGAFKSGDLKDLKHAVIMPALEIIQKNDPEWVGHWLAEHLVDGFPWCEDCAALLTSIPEAIEETLLLRLEGEDVAHPRHSEIIAVLGARPDASLAARVFSRLCALRRTLVENPNQRQAPTRAIDRLKDLFRALPANVAVAGLSTRFSRDIDAIELALATDLFASRGTEEPDLRTELSAELRQAFREYLKSGVPVVLSEKDLSGESKCSLAMALARVGEPEDMPVLYDLIRKDIERVRNYCAALASGGPPKVRNLAPMSWSHWYIRAASNLDPSSADALILELLREPEYEGEAASALSGFACPRKREGLFGSKKDYSSIWEARAGASVGGCDETRRKSYATAITSQVTSLLRASATATGFLSREHRLAQLAVPLAVIDGRDSADLVMKIVSLLGKWQEWKRAEALQALLFRGARLPAEDTMRLIEPVLKHIRDYPYESQMDWLLDQILCLLPFVDPPSAGINKVRQLIPEFRLRDYELCNVVTSLGHSRCREAVDFLKELTPSAARCERLGEAWANAIAALECAESKRLLLGFVDPDAPGAGAELQFAQEDALASAILKLTRRDIAAEQRLFQLCSQPLSPYRRNLLANVVGRLHSPEALLASLNLIDDDAAPAIPREIWELIEGAFVERRPYEGNPHAFTRAPRAFESIRTCLFEMAMSDKRRNKAAADVLAQIELWRLEYGRPLTEPRHPDVGSGVPWPISGALS